MTTGAGAVSAGAGSTIAGTGARTLRTSLPQCPIWAPVRASYIRLPYSLNRTRRGASRFQLWP